MYIEMKLWTHTLPYLDLYEVESLCELIERIFFLHCGWRRPCGLLISLPFLFSLPFPLLRHLFQHHQENLCELLW